MNVTLLIMASEFYRRTKDLFEEFQNRELHYQKLEKNSDFRFTNNKSMPAEEYLQKLNQREKETEKTYRDLMNNLEALDRRTDRISEKLEKLHLLRSAITSKVSSWPSTNHIFDKPILASSYSLSANTLPTNFDLKYVSSNASQIPLSQFRDTKHATTQTDYIFCQKCHFPLMQSQVMANIPVSIDEFIKNSTSSQPQDIIQHNEGNQSIPNYLSPQNGNSHSTIDPTNEKLVLKNMGPEDSLVVNKIMEFQQSTSISKNNEYVSNIHSEKTVNYVPSQTSINIQIHSDKKDFIEENSHVMKNDVPSGNNLIKTSKRDDENLDQEFDFLEHDKKSKEHETAAEKSSKLIEKRQNTKTIEPVTNFASDAVSNHTQEEIEERKINESNARLMASLELDAPVKDVIERESNTGLMPSLELDEPVKDVIVSVSTKSEEAIDNKSESSVSIGGVRSPSLLSEKVSIVSDSDSFYEKEEPHLTASAAYQALLGNISIPKNISKPAYSETESEDEIERALATTARKSSSVPVASATNTDEKVKEKKKTDSETKSEPRKSISVPSKSQQLSKKTRKVLGLETSSASDEDLQIKVPATKKIEEDSDEFDFYD